MGQLPGKLTPEEFENLISATQFSARDLKRLHKRFQKLDKDGSGAIDQDELLQVASLAVNPLVYRIISIFDQNGDKEIDFNEFIEGITIISVNADNTAKMRMAFKVYDMDNDGYISNGELYQVLKMMVGSNLNDVQLQQIVDKTIIEADTDRDGKISFEEFCAIIEKSNTNISSKMTIQF